MKRSAIACLGALMFLAFGAANAEGRDAGERWSPPAPQPWKAPLQFLPTAPLDTVAEERDARIPESPAASSRGAMPRAPLAVSATQPLGFVAMAPCRQYDSRNATPLAQATTRNITLTGAPCGIPAGAAAVSVNIAVFNIAGAGSNGVFVVGLPGGATQAFLNYPPGQGQIDNAGAVKVDGTGALLVGVNQGGGSVDFVVDVNGYYSSAGTVYGAESLRVLRGMIDGTNGVAVIGAGFTASRVGVGQYIVTFTQPFPGPPTPILTVFHSGGATAVLFVLGFDGFSFSVYNAAGALVDPQYILVNVVGPP